MMDGLFIECACSINDPDDFDAEWESLRCQCAATRWPPHVGWQVKGCSGVSL